MSQASQPAILIVDDNAEIRDLLDRYILRPEGYRVLQAANGRAGLALALKEAPDLILLDINLPDISGLDVLRELRKASSHADVVFITSDDSLMVAIEALRLGVRDYLLKPLSIDDVQKTVRRIISQRQVEERNRRLQRELVAAESIRKTAVTLAHRINNDLMALGGNLVLLRDVLAQSGNEEALALVRESLQSARRIHHVLQQLQQTTAAKTEPYDQYTGMIHIAEPATEP